MTDFTINTEAPTRNIDYVDTSEEEYLTITITPKEAVDVYNALQSLSGDVASGRFETDLPVEAVQQMTRGGIHFPKESSLFLDSETHARVIIHALAKYEPPEADFTDRLQTDLLSILEDIPMEIDTDTLRQISMTN